MALLGITHRSRDSRGGSPGWARGMGGRMDRQTYRDRQEEGGDISVQWEAQCSEGDPESFACTSSLEAQETDEESSELIWA